MSHLSRSNKIAYCRVLLLVVATIAGSPGSDAVPRNPIYVIRPFEIQEGKQRAWQFANEFKMILPDRVHVVQEPEDMPDCRKLSCETVQVFEEPEGHRIHHIITFTRQGTPCGQGETPFCGMRAENCWKADILKLRDLLAQHDRKIHGGQP